MRSLNFSFLRADNGRTGKVKKNIFASFLIKLLDTIVLLLLVPLTLGYLNAYEYGIWVTLNSVLAWINSFDIGLGNGLRNKLSIALSENNYEKGRYYVSTTFFMLILLSIAIFFIFSLIIDIVDWYALLNVDESVVVNLKEIILISFLFFCLNFILKFIGNVYQALQLPSVNYLICFSGNTLSLIIILLMKLYVPASLLGVALVYSAAIPVVYLICYPITFHFLYPQLTPSLRYFKTEYIKDLLSLGGQFFIIQIMALVLFSFSNLIISNLFGPDQVTPYNIAFRYFSVIPMLYNIVISPIWSAATDAYAKGDMQWIRICLNRILRILMVLTIVVALMVIVADFVYKIWIGNSVSIPFSMSLLVGIYNVIILYSLSYSYFLNGMGVLRLQLINIIVVAILFYPICYYLAGIWSLNGILMGMCLTNISGAVLNTIQMKKLISGTAQGIWLK